MPVFKYWDPNSLSYKKLSFLQKGDKGDPGPPGPPGGEGSLDSLSDVSAPPSTPAGKVLGTTSTGAWEPVDHVDETALDAKYVQLTGSEMTGGLTTTLLIAQDIISWGGMQANGTVRSMSEPVEDDDAATKAYVDGRIWSGSQAEYDAIATKDPTVLYVITS